MLHFDSSIRPNVLLFKLIFSGAGYILLSMIRDTEKHFLMSRQCRLHVWTCQGDMEEESTAVKEVTQMIASDSEVSEF